MPLHSAASAAAIRFSTRAAVASIGASDRNAGDSWSGALKAAAVLAAAVAGVSCAFAEKEERLFSIEEI